MQRDENYPRPQLMRPHWTDLGGEWQFAYDDANKGLNSGWVNNPAIFKRKIRVPFPPEATLSGIGETGFHPVVWYRRTFRLNKGELAGEKRLILHFGAVDYSAQVWVNGKLVAQHEGGNTPFSADITPVLVPEGEQIVVLRAEDQPHDLTQPRGKQYWEENPRKIWYHRTTGIWQPVWYEVVSETYIDKLRWTPDLEKGSLGLEISLNQKPARPLRLELRLSLNDKTLAHDSYFMERSELHRSVALESGDLTMSREKILWSPRYPNLIDAELRLYDGDRLLDEVLSYAGLRSVGFANGRFLLNGFPHYLRLVLEQGYWTESLLSAPSGEALHREVELIKELGFNGVRIHQKVEDPRFLYWCDRLGLMVWGEMANAYVFSKEAVQRFTREWLEVVQRDYSHPCVVTWVPFNESWGVPALERDPAQQHYVKALYHLTHALDSTRPVIGNDGWEHVTGDVWGIHDYAVDGATITARYGTPEAVERTLYQTQPHYRTVVLPDARPQGQPIMLTECGGISYAPKSGEKWWGYGTVQDDQTFLEKYGELIGAILDCPTVVGFCYTQLTDTEQETNGLLRADRTPKLNTAGIRDITRRAPRSMPGEVINILQNATEITSFQQGGS
jgi:beta-galactosidase/beta-glucuronidase